MKKTANTIGLTTDFSTSAETTRARRLEWWQQARFGMFVHWGVYAQLERGEWVMNRERTPVAEYEKLADSWKPTPHAAREWATLAKRAGMKYIVMTTKHHDGFLLWDSKMSSYNAAARGPGRDLVREYVDAAREAGLHVGLYYSLMDWHHPDGVSCATDPAARRRFLDYTQGCLRELMTRYGKIDILWYDGPCPFSTAELWESPTMNAMIRHYQPGILINDRSQSPEDFSTPEGHIRPAEYGRAWESCITFNGAWGWQPTPADEWVSTRRVINMLRQVAAGGGNLLLNIGPKPDGSVPVEAVERLTLLGKWMRKYGRVVYGKIDRVTNMDWVPAGDWTRRDDKMYFWCGLWSGGEVAIGGLTARLLSARLYPDGRPLPFEQTANRLVIRGLPRQCPDKIAGVAIIEMKFDGLPQQHLGAAFTPADRWPYIAAGKWASPFMVDWMLSSLMPRKGGVEVASCVSLRKKVDWQPVRGKVLDGFVSVHARHGNQDGIVYLANRFKVERRGVWTVFFGHDGGARVFVDGRSVYQDGRRENPARSGRGRFDLALAKGEHEIVIALDTDHGNGWGIFLQFEVARQARQGGRKPDFPVSLFPCIA